MWCPTVSYRNGRQFGRAGHIRQPLLPPPSVSLTRGFVLLALLALGAIAPVAVTGRRQGRPPVQLGQIRNQHAVAHRVGRQHVDVQVQPAEVLVEQRQRDVDDLTVFNFETLVGFTVAQLRQCGFHLLRTLSAQVDHGEHRSTRPGHRLLSPVRKESGTKHRMCRDEVGHRTLQAPGIYSLCIETIEFNVDMGRDAAELLLIGAAYPVRMLHGGQWERGVVRNRLSGLSYEWLCRASAFIRTEHSVPRSNGGTGRKLGKGDAGPAFAPASRQRHHADRVQAQLNQIVVVCYVCSRATELGRNRSPDLVPADPASAVAHTLQRLH